MYCYSRNKLSLIFFIFILITPGCSNIQSVNEKKTIQSIISDMVLIPSGKFEMGSHTNTSRTKNEKPLHTVHIRAFKMMSKEVTFEQYATYARDRGKRSTFEIHGYGSKDVLEDEAWGRGKRPIIHVNWFEAQDFARWISTKTGKRFRLPSEAEWEYAARSASESNYSWGDNINCSQARFGDHSYRHQRFHKDYPCKSKDGTYTVASFQPNAYGLYDMHGNVAEWTQDCWNIPTVSDRWNAALKAENIYDSEMNDYNAAPTNGKAWIHGHCFAKVYRGGSWLDSRKQLRNTYRAGTLPEYGAATIGFRLVQDLEVVAVKENQNIKPIIPKMVILPAGNFQMGSNSKTSFEKPVHNVHIKSFKIMSKEVTFAEYDLFVKDTGIAKPDDAGWGRGNRPVINIKLLDADAYAEWLSNKTARHFRLPTEAEWEYAARIGNSTTYKLENCILNNQANFNKLEQKNCLSKSLYRFKGKSFPVGSFTPTEYGLYGMHGNVKEFVQDYWNDNYNGAPDNGKAWLNGDFGTTVVRGFPSVPSSTSRSSVSFSHEPDIMTFKIIGFRLVEDIY